MKKPLTQLKELCFQFQVEEAKLQFVRQEKRLTKNAFAEYHTEAILKAKLEKYDAEIDTHIKSKNLLLEEIRDPKRFGEVWRKILKQKSQAELFS